MFGWIRSATHASMIARSGNMQIVADEAGEGHPASPAAARHGAWRRGFACGMHWYNGGFEATAETAS